MKEPTPAMPLPSEGPPVAAMPPAGTQPWYVKTPSGARPPQSEIVIDQDQTIDRQGKTFVLYAGLLNAAHKAGLISIHTTIVQIPSSLNGECAVVHASAEFPWGSFTGIGDADNQNTSRNIAPHRIRMAETRAKARALRDALNVSMVAIEEMGPDANDAPAKVPAGAGNITDFRATPGEERLAQGVGTAAPRPVGERKTYGTPLTKPVTQ